MERKTRIETNGNQGNRFPATNFFRNIKIMMIKERFFYLRIESSNYYENRFEYIFLFFFFSIDCKFGYKGIMNRPTVNINGNLTT